jgi:hypothetical protein
MLAKLLSKYYWLAPFALSIAAFKERDVFGGLLLIVTGMVLTSRKRKKGKADTDHPGDD